MNIWITGANGQLGVELKKELSLTKNNVFATSHYELDITNIEAVRAFVYKKKPNIIINCAAYTLVDNCEKNLYTAFIINGVGVRNLAIVSKKINATIVQISTDYVFAGNIKSPRDEDDLTYPQTVYGMSKLVGEQYVKWFCKKYFIVRTSWLYGEGKNFVNTMLNLSSTHRRIDVVGDQFGTPTSTKELCKAIIKLINTDYYGIFHASCEGECSWYDFACEIFKLSKIDIKLNKVTTEEFGNLTKRPSYSVLKNSNLDKYGINTFKTWKNALQDYIDS